MSDLKELIKQRGNIRARITLFEKHLAPFLDIKETSTVKINELSIRLSKIRDLACSFEDVQSQIEMLDEDTTKQMQERETTENICVNLIAQAQSLLEFFQNTSKVSNTSFKSPCNLKLPALKIPPFSGESNKWLSFRDIYISLIHDNDNIDDIGKFHYLKSYLEGAASSVINSVKMSSDNYKIAWNLLCERYNNKRLLINEHIKCLFAIEPLHKVTDFGIRELIDTLSKNLSALNSLGEPTDKWDTIIIYMASTKLDTVTAGKWEEYRSDKDSTTLEDFYSFLRQRASVLETMNASRSSKHFDKRHSLPKIKSLVSSMELSLDKRCAICKQEHKVYECPKFKSLSINDRITKVSQLKLCSICFRSGHQAYQCRMSGCRICRRKHNTLLHRQSNTHISQQQGIIEQPPLNTNENNNINENLPISVVDSTASNPSTSVSMSAVSTNQVLLSTALVKVTNNDKSFILRALLDCGSQTSFISENAHRKIGSCKRKDQYQCISGLGNIVLNVTQFCNIRIHSLHNYLNIALKCFILPKITDTLPHATVRVQDLCIPNHIQLADPQFYEPAEIDLLLGADIFWELIGVNKIILGPQKPILQETQLGWVVAGSTGGSYCNSHNPKLQCNFSQEIKAQLAKFWELEEIPSTIKNDKNNYCEKLFNETTHRVDDGRFCVQIPLKDSIEVLGDSYNIAEKRLLQLERKLKSNPTLQQEYRDFINEYERLGHMTEIPRPVFGCFLPHHAVIRETSETTKLRVVFDASVKTSTGISLNDIQHIGPVVQDDLFSILLRYRQHKFVASADVNKMYRQILVEPNQRLLQLILWRDEPSQPIKIFQLNTVTYGMASAPFLSTRCLLQLSKECNDPAVSQLIKEDFYVDDFLSGARTEEELGRIINLVTENLDRARLPLRKWRTNIPTVFQNNSNISLPKSVDLCSQSSILGLKWDPSKDILLFPVDIQFNQNITKRTILSTSAKLFDPLGLLSLCTIIPKIILQKLWLSKLDWDDSVDPEWKREWQNFITNLNVLSQIEIPRCVITSDPVVIELHSFSDASTAAYAAAVYLRSIDSLGRILVKIVCAKTKVAPVKPTTIPRLELCGALLSARLTAKVLKALRCKINKIFYWTDSTVVLSWLSSQATDLKPFVSNRVVEIQDLTAMGTWNHVPGDKNPADLASRGLNPKSVKLATLWWNGPPFLLEEPSNWPKNVVLQNISKLPERKTYPKKLTTLQTTSTLTITTLQSTSSNFEIVKFGRYSKFTILQRSVAYVLRFIYNLRHKHSKLIGPLSTSELNSSLIVLIKQHQFECFSREIKNLKTKQSLPSKCHILSLSPFVDENDILRVGGRIQNSDADYKKIHPILLDTSHNFTKLLFTHHHKKLLHCGPHLLLSDLRNTFWPLRGRILARSTVNNCQLCKIMKAKCINPLMGNLPASRVVPGSPFEVSGVDFAGPYYITDRKGRGCKITKCYMCLFICFATKALHLEVASDLTSEVFILCLRRFISRRGKPLQIYCDNGTNFVGANNDITNFLKSNSDYLTGFAADEGIKFKFSPAYSPHFGGLWEAGVKSAKYHITRILGDKHLTFEELSTLFSQIEAILNSRPLTPLSSDPNDLNPLTPAHFLIGRPLTSLPSQNLLDVNPNRLDRYQYLERLRQHFWQRWKNEYLSELQQKTKWQISQRGLQEGDLVIIREANVPPLKWRMARIHKLFPGPDGITRVADLYTTKGIIRRAVNNLCPLIDLVSSASPRKPEDFEGGEDVK